MVRSSLQDGANIQATIAGDMTRLYLAARSRHPEIIRLLLEEGAIERCNRP